LKLAYSFSPENNKIQITQNQRRVPDARILPQALWEVFSVASRQRALKIAGIRKKNCG